MMILKKGAQVKIISGKDKGKTGEILEINRKLNKVKQTKLDSWSIIWTYTGFIKKYLHIIPKKNLIKNIGFDKSATNTKKIKYDIKLKDKKSFKFPLIHPPKIITNKIYDKLCEDKIFSKSLKDRLVWLLKFFNFN